MGMFLFFAGIGIFWIIMIIAGMSESEPSIKKLNKWYHKLPDYNKEKATGIYRGDYPPHNDFEAWRYVTDIEWGLMNYDEKLRKYRRIGPNKPSRKVANPHKSATIARYYQSDSYGCE